MRNIFAILFLLCYGQCVYAQLSAGEKRQVDSLQMLLKTAKHDSVTIKVWKAWADIIYNVDPRMDFELNEKIESLCAENLRGQLTPKEKLFFLGKSSDALNIIGNNYQHKGEYEKAIDYYERSLDIAVKLDDKRGIAHAFGNMSNIHKNRGAYAKAAEYAVRCMKILEKTDDKNALAITLNNIGVLYIEQGDFKKAEEYYTRSLAIQESIGNKPGIAMSLANLGVIYKSQGNFVKAIQFYNQCLELQKKIGDQRLISTTLNNIGNIYYVKKEYGPALDYYTKSLSIHQKTENKQGITVGLNNIGKIHLEKEEYTKAIDFSTRSLTIAKEIGEAIMVRDASSVLYQSYKKVGNKSMALDMYELYVSSRDSILSQENQKEVVRQELKYNYEKQALADSVRNAAAGKLKDALIAKQNALADKQRADLKSKSYQQYVLFGGLTLTFAFLGFVYNRFRLSQRQRKIIEEQKQLVEEKQKDILDSIQYAKRIQNSLMPTEKYIDRSIKRLYKK